LHYHTMANKDDY